MNEQLKKLSEDMVSAALVVAKLAEVDAEFIYTPSVKFSAHAKDKLSFQKLVKCLGKSNKTASGESFWVTRKVGDVEIILWAPSRGEVCTPKVVGTEKKTVRKLVSAAVYADVEEEVDVIEYECHPILRNKEEDPK